LEETHGLIAVGDGLHIVSTRPQELYDFLAERWVVLRDENLHRRHPRTRRRAASRRADDGVEKAWFPILGARTFGRLRRLQCPLADISRPSKRLRTAPRWTTQIMPPRASKRKFKRLFLAADLHGSEVVFRK